MAYDEGLAERVTEYFSGRVDVESKKMFGGLCFMVADHMCVGIVGELLMARVGKANYLEHLAKPHIREMDFTGKSLAGYLYIEPQALGEDQELADWISLCEAFTCTLPPKKKA